jgi:hypothetical protein
MTAMMMRYDITDLASWFVGIPHLQGLLAAIARYQKK